MADMTFHLEMDNGQCLYEQIYEHIKNEIRKGKLLSKEKLPSTRSLAEYLSVSRSTIDLAYEQLLSEGYIEAVPCKGYYVASRENLIELNIPKDKLKSVGTRKIENLTYEEDHIKEDKNYQYDFSPYGVDMSVFPFEVWKKITKNILNYGNAELFSQGAPQGDADLRETISKYLHSSRGVNCRPEQIVVGAGTDYLLMLLEKVFDRKMRVAMEDPTYVKAYRIFKSFGYEIESFNLKNGGFKIDDIVEKQINVIYTMPSHQFPTGTVMSVGKRIELLKWANAGENRYIIEDDYDSEFRYRGKPIPSLQASDEFGRVIYMGTFSKAIAPAIRVSFMVLPEELLEKYREVGSFYSCTVSRIDQKILDEFIRDGYFERYLNKMRKKYKNKHALLMEGLKPFADSFLIAGENAGLHILLKSKNGIIEDELVKRALDVNIKVYRLSDSFVEKKNENNTVLLGFGSMPEEKIKEGLKVLQKVYIDK